MQLNDNFADSFDLIGSSDSAIGSNVGFTGEPGEPNHAGISPPLNSAWWSWRAPASGVVTIDTFGSNYDTSLAVYTGSALNNLSEIASNDDSNSFQSEVSFTATAGTTYQIAVDGFSSSTGQIDLNLELDLVFTQVGTAGSDNLNGSGANDVIRGLGGNDQINGNGGNDVLFGNGGNDQINGASQGDLINGGAGSDTINGNGGSDTLIGGGGSDTIAGASGNDVIIGGGGGDTIFGNGGDDYINSGTGLDTVFLGTGAVIVVLETGAGFDLVNNFQVTQAKFQLGDGLSFAELSFVDSNLGVNIFADNDLLAVVAGNQASLLNNSELFIF
ncbi:MAG: calcium-binding protein [Symploca sp. SIO2B6]|nr:calcium-binding protein [Symploca sp. SIO2B6]